MKLGARQRELLERVCRSNGGGVGVNIESDRVAQSLEKHGLIQGKAGSQWRAVHTPAGLALYRQWIADMKA